MEIIRKGQVPEERQFETECGKCSTVFRFKRSEAQYCHDQRDGDFLAVLCPVCFEQVNKDVNAYIRPEPPATWKDL